MVVSTVKLSRGRGSWGICCGRERDESQTHNLACLLAGELAQELDGSLMPPAWSHQFTGLFQAPRGLRTTRFRSVPTPPSLMFGTESVSVGSFSFFAGQVQNCIRDPEEKQCGENRRSYGVRDLFEFFLM